MSRDMSAEQCSNKRNNLKEAILQIHDSKELYDVTFVVGKRKFKAHRLILASRCEKLKNLLTDNKAVDEDIVDDESITEKGFEIFLRFIYTDTLGTDDKKSIVEACIVANFYKQNKLKGKCEELMTKWTITVDEVCELLNVSLGINILKEKCLQFIKSKAENVIDSPGFFKLNHNAMICILENNVLKDVELKKSIAKIIEWGARKKECTNNYGPVRDYFLKVEPPLMRKLRIEELPADKITELFIVRYKGLLLPEEVVQFMEYFHTKEKKALPEWCIIP